MNKAFIVLEDDYDEIKKDLQQICLLEGNEIEECCKRIIARLTKMTINDEILLRGTRQDGLDLKDVEREKLIDALVATNWRQNKAAELLGVSARVMNYKVKKHKLTNPHWNKNKPKKEKSDEHISKTSSSPVGTDNIFHFDKRTHKR